MASRNNGRRERSVGARAAARLRRAPSLGDLPSITAVAIANFLLKRRPLPGSGLVSEESPVIVAGMHRSGTSLVTRLLERGGMYAGGSWVDRNHEAIHFGRANRAMMGEGPYLLRDYGWTAPKTDEYLWARRGYAEQAAAKVSIFFAERTSEAVWGWKDPRNCLTLPIWLAVYPAARVLHVLRDGRAVALSLTERNGLDPLAGLGLWEQYVTRCERALEAVPESRKLTVRFEDLTQAPVATLERLYGFAQLEPSESLTSIASTVDSARGTARLADSGLNDARDHPLLARYNYS